MKYYFGDNREYGADDLKAALGVLVAKGGVSIELSDGVDYEPSKLNSLVGSAVAAGVVPESNSSLRLNAGDTYTVSPGKAVFSDGGIAVVEEETTVNAQAGQYVYLAYSSVLDDVYFLCSDTEQTEGNGVLLVPIGRVLASGAVENRRVYAHGKIPALASASWSTLRDVELSIDVSSIGKSGGYVECVHEIEGEMNFMMVDSGSYVGLMYLDGAAPRYSTVFRISSSEHGYSKDYIAVGHNGYGFVSGTLLEKGNGYIKMRYRVPGYFSGGVVTFTAMVGLKK